MPLWALIILIGVVVYFLAHTGLGALLILIGIILLVVELAGGLSRR